MESGASADERIVRLPPSAGAVSKIVLEFSYSLEKASASRLAAPRLPKDVPVQQTIWRVWIPGEDVILGADRNFSRLTVSSAKRLVGDLGKGQPSPVAFTLPAEGTLLNFLRQGRAETLRVTALGRETFCLIVWAAILAAGLAMLKLSGLLRSVIVLLALLAGSVASLSVPQAIWQILYVGWLAAVLVVLAWLVQWYFLRRKTMASAAPAPATGPTAQSPPPSENPPVREGPPASDGPSQEKDSQGQDERQDQE